MSLYAVYRGPHPGTRRLGGLSELSGQIRFTARADAASGTQCDPSLGATEEMRPLLSRERLATAPVGRGLVRSARPAAHSSNAPTSSRGVIWSGSISRLKPWSRLALKTPARRTVARFFCFCLCSFSLRVLPIVQYIPEDGAAGNSYSSSLGLLPTQDPPKRISHP